MSVGNLGSAGDDRLPPAEPCEILRRAESFITNHLGSTYVRRGVFWYETHEYDCFGLMGGAAVLLGKRRRTRQYWLVDRATKRTALPWLDTPPPLVFESIDTLEVVYQSWLRYAGVLPDPRDVELRQLRARVAELESSMASAEQINRKGAEQ